MFWIINYSSRQRGGRNKKHFTEFLFTSPTYIFIFNASRPAQI